MAISWKSEKRKLKDLKDFDKNPRKIDKKAFQKLVESIKSDGYHQRLLINTDGTIIGGHARKKALLNSGIHESTEIEVLVPDRQLTEEEFNRINIRDNLPYGEYDFEILANNFDAEQLIDWGMPEEWLYNCIEDINTDVLQEDNEIPEHVEPRTKLGDLYQLGQHRLLCGDSTNALDVQKLIAEFNPNLMVTDPPYGVNYEPEWREKSGKRVGETSKGLVKNDDRADWTDAYSLFTGSVAYVWHSALHTHTFAQNLIDCGYKLVSQIIWVKHHFALSRGDYHWQHEPCWYAVKEGCDHAYNGKRDQSTTWEIESNNSFGKKGDKEETVGHGTQKPIECMLRPILNNSKPGEYIYDPFLGSGTTLIACEKSDRKCLGMELSPHYCDVIIARWEKHTGKKAELIK